MKKFKILTVLFLASSYCYAAPYVSPQYYRLALHNPHTNVIWTAAVATGETYKIYLKLEQDSLNHLGINPTIDVKNVTKIEIVELPSDMSEQACKNAKLLKTVVDNSSSPSRNDVITTTLNNFNNGIGSFSYLVPTTLNGIYGTFTARISWSDPGSPNIQYQCKTPSFIIQPAAYELYNFERFKDATGKWIEVGPIHVENDYMDSSTKSAFRQNLQNSYSKNIKIRDDIQIPVLIAGKEYPSIGVRALGLGKNNEFDKTNRHLKEANKPHEHLVLTDYGTPSNPQVVDGFYITTPKSPIWFKDISQFPNPMGVYKHDGSSNSYANNKYGYHNGMWSGIGWVQTDVTGAYNLYMYDYDFLIPSYERNANITALYSAYTMAQPDCGLIFGEAHDLSYTYTAEQIDSDNNNLGSADPSGLPIPRSKSSGVGEKYDFGLKNYQNKSSGKSINPNLPELDIQHFAPLRFVNGEARLRMKDGSAFKFNGVGAAIVSGATPDAKIRGNNSENQFCDPSNPLRRTEECYGSLALNFVYFIPDHIEISNFKVENFGAETGDQTGMTYIRSAGKMDDNPDNKADMYATISFDVEVKDAEGKTPIGYTQNCYARDIDFRVNLAKQIPELEDVNGKQLTLGEAKDAIGFFNDPVEYPTKRVKKGTLMEDDVNNYYIYEYEVRTINHEKVSEKKEKDEHGNPYRKQDGFFTLKADSWFQGKAKAIVRINFDRDISKPIKPFEVTSDMFNITEVKDTVYGITLNDTIKNNNVPNIFTPSQEEADITRVKFYYGIAYSAGGKTTVPGTITPITYFGVYCLTCDQTKFKTTSASDWQKLGAMSGWYINELHNQTKPTSTANFGYISQYTPEKPFENIVEDHAPIHNISTDRLSFSSNKAEKSQIIMTTNPWLVYAPTYTSGVLPTSNTFNLVFTGAGFWAGKSVNKEGVENTTGVIIGTDIKQSNKSSNRINW